MSNVVGMNEFVGMANGDLYCWLCQKPVSTRALFCHNCGTVQPVRNIDHFARLGLDRSLDVDVEQLDRQYATLSKTLSPERFLIRGMGERGHATKQLEALKEAYAVLRDPLRRGRYWLQLNEQELKNDASSSSLVEELRRELAEAVDPSHCDRIAQKAGQALEQGVMLLMQALRGGDWLRANQTLVQIDGVEAIFDDVRSKREKLVSATE